MYLENIFASIVALSAVCLLAACALGTVELWRDYLRGEYGKVEALAFTGLLLGGSSVVLYLAITVLGEVLS